MTTMEKVEKEALKRYVTEAASVNQVGDKVVHVLGSFIGADWSLEAALSAIDEATHIEWAPNTLDHNLAVRSPNGMLWRFNVRES